MSSLPRWASVASMLCLLGACAGGDGNGDSGSGDSGSGGTAGTGGTGSVNGSDLAGACASMCALCPQPAVDCEDSCVANGSGMAPGCESELAAWYTCVANGPASNVTCGGGEPKPVESACPDELSGAFTCINHVYVGTLPEDPALGTPCVTLGESCGAGLECIDVDFAGGPSCTATCDDGSTCPENAYCLTFDGDDGHLCVPLCESDADCTAISPGTYCAETKDGNYKTCSSD